MQSAERAHLVCSLFVYLTRTTTKLLEDLHDAGNIAAWGEFDLRYRSLLVGFARHMGFGPEDAAEIAQRVLAEFSQGQKRGEYRRDRGRLRSWLIGIARHVGSDLRRERGRERVGGNTAAIAQATDDVEPDLLEAWRLERDRVVLDRALATLRENGRTDEQTFLAFELFALRGVPADQVAALCGMSVDSVYVAKNRLTKRLRQLVREMTHVYEEDE